MREVLFLLVAFVHDLATGIWFGAWLLYIYIHRKWTASPEISIFLTHTMFYSLVLVFLTGFLRMWEYRAYGASATKRKFLLVKHLLLIPILIGGTVWVYLGGT